MHTYVRIHVYQQVNLHVQALQLALICSFGIWVLCSFGIWGFRFWNLGISVLESDIGMVLESDQVVLESGCTRFGIQFWNLVLESSFGI